MMNKPIRRLFGDTLASLISGLGGSKDKMRSLFYYVNELDRTTLDAMYRGDWIAKKIITIPVKDALRQWRDWQADNAAIEAIEKVERQHKIKYKAASAFTKGRHYGGGALVLGVKGTGPANTPLDLEDVKKDSLEFVHVVSRWSLTNQAGLETDIMSPWFLQPKMYSRQVKDSAPIDIHPSRIVRMIGEPYPDDELSPDGWGESVLVAIQDAVRQAGLVPQSMATVIEELKVDVIKIPGLSDQLGDEASTTLLSERLSYGMQAKSTLNTLVMDKDDEWERINQNLTGFPDLIKMYLLIASGAADIPVTRFLGQSPAGLNSTGESDIRNYYDHVKSDQVDKYSSALETLDEVIIRSATGSRDENIFYEWNPLWQLTESEEAEIASKKAAVVKMDVDMMLIPTDALAQVRQNQLIEDGTYPGLESALEESDGEVVNPKLEAQLQMQEMKGQQAKEVTAIKGETIPTTDEYDPNQPRDDQGRWTNFMGMREYAPKELDWEYEREYKVYAQPSFPDAFTSREDFQRKYDAAPLVHLSERELRQLDNSMAASAIGKDVDWLHETFGFRRDVGRILKQMEENALAPPIVLNSGGRHFLMAGQTRIAVGLATGRIVPVKLIDVPARQRRTRDHLFAADSLAEAIAYSKRHPGTRVVKVL